MRNSSWTGRAPRSLHQAFGPYTNHHITGDSRQTGYGWAWWAAMVVCCVLTLIAV